MSSELTSTDGLAAFNSAGSFEHAQRVAKMLSSSNLIPKDYQGNIQNTLIALEISTRTGASPLMVMQNLNVIQGRPSWSSPFIIAALNSCKRFSPIRFSMSGDGDEYGCTAWATDIETKEKLEGPKVDWNMVKAEGWSNRNGSKWKTMPDLMFRYRAASFFGRLYAPDILMGMLSADEVVDANLGERNSSSVIVDFDQLNTLASEKINLLTEDEKTNVQRILDNKEEKSYLKLFKLLQEK